MNGIENLALMHIHCFLEYINSKDFCTYKSFENKVGQTLMSFLKNLYDDALVMSSNVVVQ